ncbi:Winged helix-turn helix, partial [Anaerocolumna jejuensis DSM 15929]
MARPSKYSCINLSADEVSRLTDITSSRTEMVRTVQRAKIILLTAEGISVTAIADKLDLNRKSVELCLDKYLESGLETALSDNPGRGRKSVIMDDDKSYV